MFIMKPDVTYFVTSCAKTTLARAMARAASVAFIAVDLASVFSAYLGYIVYHLIFLDVLKSCGLRVFVYFESFNIRGTGVNTRKITNVVPRHLPNANLISSDFFIFYNVQ